MYRLKVDKFYSDNSSGPSLAHKYPPLTVRQDRSISAKFQNLDSLIRIEQPQANIIGRPLKYCSMELLAWLLPTHDLKIDSRHRLREDVIQNSNFSEATDRDS